MASLSYDLVVLGDDFAGLVTACLCASRGMRVLLAEVATSPLRYRFDDELLPIDSAPLSGLESAAADRVIAELNFQHLFKRRIHPIDPPCQLLTEDIRLAVDTDKERFAKSLRRELGTDESWLLSAEQAQEGFPQLLSSEACIPPTGFWERREIAKHMDPLHSRSDDWLARECSHNEKALSDIVLTGEIGLPVEDAFSRSRCLTNLQRGLVSVDGEADAWRSIFLDKFQSHSGEVRRVLPQSLEQSWGKVTGLRTLEDHISFDYFVSAMPIDALLPLFGNKPPKRLVELAEEISPRAFRYTLNLLVHMNGVPEGMGPVAWSLRDGELPPTGGNFASFTTTPASQSGRAIVSVQGIAEANEAGEPLLDGMREALLDHARQRMPFLDEHLEASDSPHEALVGKHKRSLGSDADTIAPSAIWQCPQDATLNLPALPYLVGPKHMCVASAQTLPTLGWQGQFIAGWSAAKLASAGIGKRKNSTKTSVLAHGS